MPPLATLRNSAFLFAAPERELGHVFNLEQLRLLATCCLSRAQESRDEIHNAVRLFRANVAKRGRIKGTHRASVSTPRKSQEKKRRYTHLIPLCLGLIRLSRASRISYFLYLNASTRFEFRFFFLTKSSSNNYFAQRMDNT